MSWHAGLPWDELRWWYYRFRSSFFSVSKPESRPTYRVKSTLDELKRLFGAEGYTPQPLSYSKGEDLSLARRFYFTSHDHTNEDGELIEWWQIHIRIWEVAESVYDIMTHFESMPLTGDTAHINGVGFEFGKAVTEVGSLLDAGGINIVEDPR